MMDKKFKQGIETLQGLDSNPSLAQSLRSLGEFYQDNSLNARRNLRGEIERNALENSKQVLSSLSEIQKVRSCLSFLFFFFLSIFVVAS